MNYPAPRSPQPSSSSSHPLSASTGSAPNTPTRAPQSGLASQSAFGTSQPSLSQSTVATEAGRSLLGSPVAKTEPIPFVPTSFEQFLNSPDMSDVIFRVGPSQIRYPAHRFLLGTHSNVFRAILFGRMKESSQLEIALPETDPESFYLFLQFLYTARADWDDSKIPSVLEQAQHYDVAQLVDICTARLREKIHASTVAKILCLANMYHNSQLKVTTGDLQLCGLLRERALRAAALHSSKRILWMSSRSPISTTSI
eukprot:TRINITY_DN13179_c0_g1_i1.p1 TRINITY_DN13179_c0_g1~~TRINITY_DN13179_c0_g1_i1.p1  ORF type:complete len:262 (-),score=29.76 TRINITY_DN13179_c0_g1_i1:283-1047(-)